MSQTNMQSRLVYNQAVPRKNDAYRGVVLRFVSNVTSNGAGIANVIATNNPNGSAKWSYFANIFDSYRVVKMMVEYVPILNLQQATSTNASPIYVIFDPDTPNSVGTTVSTVLDYKNLQIADLDKHWYFEVPMPLISSSSATVGSYTIYEGGFIDCATPTGTSSVQMLATGLAVTTTYGQYIIHWVIDFENRT